MRTLLILILFALNCEATASLKPEIVPAKGKQEAILTISEFGRYAITVTSKQGTALQLIDRMAGPGFVGGSAGETDGRLDLFLDRGTYKIITQSHEKGTGQASLQVHPFTELNFPKPPMIVELKQIEHPLRDYEQLSYWVQISERRTVVFEAAGRNLADLRLWQDGNWLVDALPQTRIVQPKKGRPLFLCQLFTELNPGLYLLTAYGGLSQPWPEDSPDHPLYLRAGIRRLPEAGRSRFVVSPFGSDYWLIPGGATYLRMELPEARSASLQAAWYDPKNPFQVSESSTSISKNSMPPSAELMVAGDRNQMRIVKITADADQPYIFQQFELRDCYPFQLNGKYWISTIHSGHPSDSVDATGLVIQFDRFGNAAPTPFLAQTIELDQKQGWSRRFNILDSLTLHFQIKESGKYQIISKGIDASFRFEPFMISVPAKYQSPEFRPSGSVWNLDAGYYVLTVDPNKAGILELGVRPYGMLDHVMDAIGLKGPVKEANVRAALHFPEVNLNPDFHYTLYLNQQPQVKYGILLRQLPLDLSDSLFVSLQPGESISVPFQVRETGTLRAQSEDGSVLSISLDNAPARQSFDVSKGLHSVTVKNAASETTEFSLFVEPFLIQAKTPLPELPDPALATIPKFPIVAENSPQHFDLKRSASTTFVVKAEQPALYSLQTVGLLDTGGNLRTRTIPAFYKEDNNGTGRNFLIQQYLREGDYQITVQANGNSEGHLGLELSRNRILDGGNLEPNSAARITVPSGQAVIYNFAITEKAEYSLRSFGIGKKFLCRLEDADGWPIEKPNIPADLQRELIPGKYRLMLMPEPVPTRRLTLLKKIEKPVRLEGHGPYNLLIGESKEHQWLETEQSKTRVPDIWQIRVPAPIDASIVLTNEMQADLLRVDESGRPTKVAYVPPQRGWKGHLEKGNYRMEVTCVRRNNRVTYNVQMIADQLIAGTERTITAPASIDVSIGDAGLVELTSFGSVDVRAQLLSADGREVTRNDDRPDDWNFQIAQTLQPGFYQLKVEPVGEQNADVTVAMQAPEEQSEKALSLPARMSVQPGNKVHIYPLEIPAQADLLVIGGTSEESVGIAVEYAEEKRSQSIGSSVGHAVELEIPLAGETPAPQRHGSYRLKVWSVDHRKIPIQLTVEAIATRVVSEAELKKGVIGTVVLKTDHAGLFRLNRNDVRWSSRRHQPCQSSSDGLMAGDAVWIVADSKVQASRISLAANTRKELTVDLSRKIPVTVDLAVPETGPALAIAKTISGNAGLSLDQPFDLHRIAVAGQSSLAVSLTSNHPTLTVWAAAERTTQANLKHFSFPPSQPQTVSAGNWLGSMKGISTREFELPAGPKRVTLALDQATAAVLANGEKVASVHWGDEEPYQEIVETDADRLILFHLRESEDGFTIEALPLDQISNTLTASSPYERTESAGGVFRIHVPSTLSKEEQRLHIRGAASKAVWITGEGHIRQGRDFQIPAKGGTLLVHHKTGLVFCWIDSKEVNGLWGSAQDIQPVTIHSPTTFPLRGRVQTFSVQAKQPVMLHVRTAVPVVTRLIHDSEEPVINVYENGASADAYLQHGGAQLSIRALGESPLWGKAEITVSEVTNIVEGLGPEVVLPAGASRSFSFQVKREGRIGVGVRADKDVVEATLLDLRGRRLGEGVAQMPELKPGTYILSLHVPEDAEAVKLRPTLVGVDLPGTGPSQEVILNYLRMTIPNAAGAATPFTAPVAKKYEASDPDGDFYEDPYDDDSGEYYDPQ